MFNVTVSLTRQPKAEISETSIELAGQFLTVEEMLLNSLTIGDHVVVRLGLSVEERAELLHVLQFRQASRNETRATAECTFGVVTFAWTYQNDDVEGQTVVTAVTVVTIENVAGNESGRLVQPVYGVAQKTGPEQALAYCREKLGAADAHYSLERWTAPLAIVTGENLNRGFYEGTYLRSYPTISPAPMHDTHLVVTLVTNNICSINARACPAWFEVQMFSGDYPADRNPFTALHAWFEGMEVTPYRNADGAWECVELARVVHAEIANLLRQLGSVEATPNDVIGLGEVLTFGHQGGLCLQVSRIVPPTHNLFALPAAV